MARKPRIEFEGAVYHVIVRENHRSDIFRDRSDRVATLIGSSTIESAIAATVRLRADV